MQHCSLNKVPVDPSKRREKVNGQLSTGSEKANFGVLPLPCTLAACLLSVIYSNSSSQLSAQFVSTSPFVVRQTAKKEEKKEKSSGESKANQSSFAVAILFSCLILLIGTHFSCHSLSPFSFLGVVIKMAILQFDIDTNLVC